MWDVDTVLLFQANAIVVQNEVINLVNRHLRRKSIYGK